jgi:hypothetical protein
MLPILQPPTDGFTELEKLFIKDLLLYIYREIEDPVSRFIMMAHFECGYNQVEISSVVGMTQPAVFKRIRKVQAFLRDKKSKGEI